MIARVLCICTLFAATVLPAAADTTFTRWLEALWPEAQAHGVSRATFDAATRGLEPDLSLPDLDIGQHPSRARRGQAEFVQTPTQYLDEGNLSRLAAQGRALLARHRKTLDAITQEFGVPPELVLAIWGRETAYGAHKLRYNAIQVLATQAWVGRRKERFREEFLLALELAEEDHIALADMRSSWAGAMGQTQFMPSDFFRYAVDFDGDGKRDIWNSIPDTLASAARQLAAKGWRRGEAWAYEVRVPPGIDCTTANPDLTMTVAQWAERGITPARGIAFDRAARDLSAALLMPAGIYGPAFLIPRNYYVIKEYNFSDLYVLFVGQLADRIAGGTGFVQPWRPVKQLASADLETIQKRLTARGLYADKIDGKAGMRTRLAVGAYQKAAGLPLDCWPNAAVLQSLRE